MLSMFAEHDLSAKKWACQGDLLHCSGKTSELFNLFLCILNYNKQ